MEKRIISVLIGLVGACNNNPKTANTDRLIVKALAFTPNDSDNDEVVIKGIIDELRSEKNRIAPGCAFCVSPCGNTSDYDMNRIDASEKEIRQLKLQILSELHEIAIDVQNKALNLDESNVDLLYRGLSFISYDMEAERLKDYLNQLQKIKEK